MKKENFVDTLLILIIIIYNFLVMFLSFFWVFTPVFKEEKNTFFVFNNVNLIYVSNFFFAGLIGGSFYCLRALYQRLSDAYTPQNITKREHLPDPKLIFNVKVWLFWYIYRPIQGGVLSVVMLCLFSQGVMGISGMDKSKIDSLLFQIGIGFLVGFGTHEVINKIEEIIKVLFSKKSTTINTRENSITKINENEELKI